MEKNANISICLSYLLRHNPGPINLDMDKHGWVDVTQLISNVNAAGQHTLSTALLREIVDTDSKGRYRIRSDGKRIKACQGQSISWVEPELEAMLTPQNLPRPAWLLESLRTMSGVAMRSLHLFC